MWHAAGLGEAAWPTLKAAKAVPKAGVKPKRTAKAAEASEAMGEATPAETYKAEEG